MSYREMLARDIRRALGELNDDAEPVLVLVSGLAVRIKELEAELATARTGWQETIAKIASHERPAYDEQQQRIAKLEAIELGLTKTLVEFHTEHAELVEALARCRQQASYTIGDIEALQNQLSKIRDIANEAIAAHRKGGEK